MPNPGGDAALKMRATIDAAGIMAGPASEALLALVVELRPWVNEAIVSSRLRTWATHYWGADSLCPGDPDGAVEVAQLLARWGASLPPPDESTALMITLAALRRVACGRPPQGTNPVTDYLRQGTRGGLTPEESMQADELADVRVPMYPPSTTRRWRKAARNLADDNPEDGGLSIAFERLQRELDLAELIRKGYSLPNARAWLRRNRGKHATAASPPRRPKIDGGSREGLSR
jgi:hypothetical protein